MLPHPIKFSEQPPQQPPQQQPPPPQQPQPKTSLQPKKLIYRPIEGFSDWISPASRVYRGLTPQFKVFLNMAVMTLGGCIWAEKRYSEYIALVRKIKRSERERARWV